MRKHPKMSDLALNQHVLDYSYFYASFQNLID
jgi:hypothetical protein